MVAPIDSSVLSNATLTASGSATFQNTQNDIDPYVELLIHVNNTPTGTSPTLQFALSVSEDNVNFDQIFTGTAIPAAGPFTFWQRTVFSNSSTNGPIMENWIKVSWTVGGTTPSWTGVYADLLFSNPTEG